MIFETEHRGSSVMHDHRHSSPFVTIVLAGAYVEVRDTAPELCRSGTIVVHAASEAHADRFSSDTRCLNVELPQSHPDFFPLGNVALDTSALQEAVAGVLRSFYERAQPPDAAVESLQVALLARPLESAGITPRWLPRVLSEFDWVAPVPLREAAAMAGLHETHFSRAFRRHTGMTAGEYRARARIEAASKLLLSSTASVASVALGTGFSDQSHLTRTFTERLGLSPAGYRRIFAR